MLWPSAMIASTATFLFSPLPRPSKVPSSPASTASASASTSTSTSTDSAYSSWSSMPPRSVASSWTGAATSIVLFAGAALVAGMYSLLLEDDDYEASDSISSRRRLHGYIWSSHDKRDPSPPALAPSSESSVLSAEEDSNSRSNSNSSSHHHIIHAIDTLDNLDALDTLDTLDPGANFDAADESTIQLPNDHRLPLNNPPQTRSIKAEEEEELYAIADVAQPTRQVMAVATAPATDLSQQKQKQTKNTERPTQTHETAVAINAQQQQQQQQPHADFSFIVELIESESLEQVHTILEQLIQLQGPKSTSFNADKPIDESGQTLLHSIADLSSPFASKCIHVLLQLRANPNVQDETGMTPLQAAVLVEDVEACRYLLDAKADSHLPDVDGDTPHSCAMESQNQTLISLFSTHHAQQ